LRRRQPPAHPGRGLLRDPDPPGVSHMSGRRLTVAAGVVIAVAALAGMDPWATRSLTGHMLQHVVLMTVAAPLIAFGLPWSAGRAWPLWLGGGVVLQAAAMIGWHLPAP